MTSTEGYQAFYMSLKDTYLAVSRVTATLLYMLGRSSRATTIVEFGTSFGVSTLHLAAALRDNGGGRLVGTEPRLSEGALVVADNADWCPEYLARVRDPGGGYASVPFASDVEVSMRLGGRAVAA